MSIEPIQYESTDSPIETHLWDYVQIVLTRIKVAAVLLLVTIVLTALYTFTREPQYKATSRVLIERQMLNLTGMRGTDGEIQSTKDVDRDFMPTQVKLITSRPVLEGALISGVIDLEDFSEAVDPIAKLASIVQVAQIRHSRLVDVSVLRPKPKEAAALVNSIVQSFIEESRQRRLGISNEGLLQLGNASEELRAKLDEANNQMNDFLIDHNIVSFEESMDMVNDRMKGLNEALWRLEPVRLSLQAQVEGARIAMAKGRSIRTLPAVLEAPIINTLTVELTQLGLERAEMQQRFGTNHPQLKSLDMQREALRSQISIISTALLSSLATRLDQANKEIDLLREAIQEQEASIADFNEIATEYGLLLRNRNTIEGNYQRINQRIEEISLNKMGGQGEHVFVISPADIPTVKFSPDPLKHLLLGSVFGTILAIGACFFLEYMDTSVATADEVADILGCGVLGTIPRLKGESIERGGLDLIAIEDTQGNLAEAFRVIRTSLSFSSPGKPLKHLVVTSSLPHEGKTLSTINLAITHAIHSKTVLLVDADMRNPRVHQSLELENERGLANLLSTSAENLSVETCVQRSHIKNLDVLTSGGIPPNPAELLDSKRFSEILQQLETMYDLIILDSPPGNPVIDATLIAKQVDGVVIVCRLFTTPSGAVEHLASLVRSSGAHLLGTIINGADQRTKHNLSHYGQYGYGYGQDHDEVEKGVSS